MITFIRIRPAEAVSEVEAGTRRREGTTTLEIGAMTTGDVIGAVAGGLLPVASVISDAEPAAWVV
ncbi:MAG: hypothetical protein A2146_04080 [Actinobacteria bacterium RBG_16_67_10]|nr:MAG: hypothetical protein A2146_04080 [Actinobacteria bacterium RBG_16_67_10]